MSRDPRKRAQAAPCFKSLITLWDGSSGHCASVMTRWGCHEWYFELWLTDYMKWLQINPPRVGKGLVLQGSSIGKNRYFNNNYFYCGAEIGAAVCEAHGQFPLRDMVEEWTSEELAGFEDPEGSNSLAGILAKTLTMYLSIEKCILMEVLQSAVDITLLGGCRAASRTPGAHYHVYEYGAPSTWRPSPTFHGIRVWGALQPVMGANPLQGNIPICSWPLNYSRTPKLYYNDGICVRTPGISSSSRGPLAVMLGPGGDVSVGQGVGLWIRIRRLLRLTQSIIAVKTSPGWRRQQRQLRYPRFLAWRPHAYASEENLEYLQERVSGSFASVPV
ncbi:hypothetical protein GGX14DRAFT_406882 [Mycena pura]|uniref:Uncharacterized protein n=1 Tax=Mycena pura TaxID=153505 RepID=A0AAD6XZA8_9AGAR|nr:hypothetical protein GGX14DRAFT_406882 [Mycena pura]